MTVTVYVPFPKKEAGSVRSASSSQNKLLKVIQQYGIDVEPAMPQILYVCVKLRRVDHINIQVEIVLSMSIWTQNDRRRSSKEQPVVP